MKVRRRSLSALLAVLLRHLDELPLDAWDPVLEAAAEVLEGVGEGVEGGERPV